ncbi:hypothetical protein [Hydrocoleum sp. CS-953]|uniref:hypothetical protein n=1 Tax=Microcoleaceae TaxID=1892252 RepID=UPI00143D24CC|nr:hypothetical protein [Hydrocoleum sp. CS-953]
MPFAPTNEKRCKSAYFEVLAKTPSLVGGLVTKPLQDFSYIKYGNENGSRTK